MEGLIQLSYLPTHSQLADVLTKILPSQQHWHLLNKLRMFPHSQLEGGVGDHSSRLHTQQTHQNKSFQLVISVTSC